ncbi:MAG: hypothetical protein ACYC2W_06905 [Desulfurivibrionaceae bacterium]
MRKMKLLFLFGLPLMLSSCASKFAVRDCENLGYVKGTPAFTECAERQLAARREHWEQWEKNRQEQGVALERAKHSGGIFGQTPVCKKIYKKDGENGEYIEECK